MTDQAALLRRTTKNVLAKAGAEVGSRLLGVLFILLAARMLGPGGFGKFTFAAALAALFSAALEFGLRPIVIREVSRAPENAERSWRIVSGLTLTLGGFLFPLLPLMAYVMQRPADTIWAVVLMGLFGFAVAFHELGIAFFTAMAVQEYELVVRLATKGLLVLGALGAVAAGGTLLEMTAAYPISALLVLPLVLWIIHRWSPRLSPVWDAAESVRFWLEAWPLAAGTLCHYASWRLPPLVLALFWNDAEVGFFGAAFRLVEALGFVPAIFVSAIFPVLAWSYGRDEGRLRSTTQKTFHLLLLLACPLAVGTMFVGGHLIRLLYGPSFAPASAMLSALIWTSAFNFLNFLFFFVFTSLRHQREVTLVAGLGLALNLLLAVPLIVWAGGVGTGLVLALAEAGMTLVGALRLRHYLPRLGLWTIAPKAVAATGVMALALWTLGAASLAVQLTIGVLAYAVTLGLLRPIPLGELTLYYRALRRREGQ